MYSRGGGFAGKLSELNCRKRSRIGLELKRNVLVVPYPTNLGSIFSSLLLFYKHKHTHPSIDVFDVFWLTWILFLNHRQINKQYDRR